MLIDLIDPSAKLFWGESLKKQTLIFKEEGKPKTPIWALVGEKLEKIILELSDEWTVKDIWKGKILLTNGDQVRIICEIVIPNRIDLNIWDQTFTVADLEKTPLHQSLKGVSSEHFSWFANRISSMTKAV